MIDNLSEALCEKEGEVMEIKKTLDDQKEENDQIKDKNHKLEQQTLLGKITRSSECEHENTIKIPAEAGVLTRRTGPAIC